MGWILQYTRQSFQLTSNTNYVSHILFIVSLLTSQLSATYESIHELLRIILVMLLIGLPDFEDQQYELKNNFSFKIELFYEWHKTFSIYGYTLPSFVEI